MKKLYIIVTVFLLSISHLNAQDSNTQELIDTYLQGLPENMEIAIGVINGKSIETKGYRIQNGQAIAVDNSGHIFEIGSITKTFTAALLIKQIREGKAHMNDPIGKHLPKSDKVSSLKSKKITLKNLITHTSGLSEEPSGMFLPILKGALFSPKSPYKYIKWKHYRKDLRKEEGYEFVEHPWAYSNFGFALLGHLVGEMEDSSWETSIQQGIFDVLGMHHSYPTVTKALKKETLVQGYRADGKAGKLWEMGFVNPAGAIKSNVSDMVLWLSAHLEAEKGSLYDDLKQSHDIKAHWKGSIMGNGWIHRATPKGTILWHGGATDSFKSFSAFNDTLKTGVVILTNYNTHHPQTRNQEGKNKTRELGMQLMAQLSGRPQNKIEVQAVVVK